MRQELSVADLKQPDAPERFRTLLQVRRKEVRKKRKSGDAFLALRLADCTGSVDARLWELAPGASEGVEVNDFVDVRGRMQVFNGHPQVTVHKLRVVDPEGVDPSQFLPSTDREVREMYGELLAAIESFENPHLRQLMRGIFREPEIRAQFERAPAATGMHHAKVGGLLEHVCSCLRMARLVASHYRELDGDLLASGVLLHDFGKIFEMSAVRTIKYTDEGRLLGHISLCNAWVAKRCEEIEGFPRRLKLLLLHMILSHHGRVKYGSPREPLFPEALALHYIDDLDARLDMMGQAIAGIASGFWSERHRGLGRPVLDRAAYLEGDRSPADADDQLEPPRRDAARALQGSIERYRADRAPSLAPLPAGAGNEGRHKPVDAQAQVAVPAMAAVADGSWD